MPTFTAKSPLEPGRARSSHERSGSPSETVTAGSVSSEFIDNRPSAVAQRKLCQSIDHSPRQTAQQQQIAQAIGIPVQRQEALEEEELLQGKFDPVQRQVPEEEELLQGQFADTEMPTQRQSTDESAANHTGMPDQLKGGLEQLSGLDLSGVRVHYNSARPAQLNALAYAQGHDIHLGPGQERHLPHESWHAVQQMQGRVTPTMQAQGVSINDDTALEHEADVMGAKALRM